MDDLINQGYDDMDHRTCRSICDAVGERLQQDMQPESGLSSRLQDLIEEMRRREAQSDL